MNVLKTTESGIYHKNVSLETNASFGNLVSSRIWIDFLKSIDVLSSSKILWSGFMGRIIDPNSPAETFSTAYSADSLKNNLYQSAKANQPYRFGNIQKISESCYNHLTSKRFFSHPPISFGASEPWSMVVSINYTGAIKGNVSDINGSSLGRVYILTMTPTLGFRNDSNQVDSSAFISVYPIIGKNTSLHFIAHGDNKLIVYINGVESGCFNIPTNFTSSFLMRGRTTTDTATFRGSINAYRLQSGAMSLQQISTEATLLQSQFPDIPSTSIGSQTWASKNFDAIIPPMGNSIFFANIESEWYHADPSYAFYDDNIEFASSFGKLYTYASVYLISSDISAYNNANPLNPFGWHVPSISEWITLQSFLGGENIAGGKLKICDDTFWNSPNIGATNDYNFSALGCGMVLPSGECIGLKNDCVFFTSTPNTYAVLSADNSKLSIVSTPNLSNVAASLRLIKD